MKSWKKNVTLHNKVKKLEAQFEALTAKNADLTQQIVKVHDTKHERMNVLLGQLDLAIGTSS